MEALKILERSQHVDWDYDEEADVPYLSFGKPRKRSGSTSGMAWSFATARRRRNSLA
jgi:hypothetical protein